MEVERDKIQVLRDKKDVVKKDVLIQKAQNKGLEEKMRGLKQKCEKFK